MQSNVWQGKARMTMAWQYGVLQDHNRSVLVLAFVDDGKSISCSKVVAAVDLQQGSTMFSLGRMFCN